MSRQRDMRVVRPSLITRQNTAMLKLVELHKLLDSWQGITHSETLARLDDHTMTVHQTSTPATRELDTTNPRVRATLRNIERYEHRLSDKAVSMALALELAPPAHCEPAYVTELQGVHKHIERQLADHLAKWSHCTYQQIEPPDLHVHVPVCTFSNTDPPHLPMPKPKQIILGHGVGSLWPHT
jgi:hypothetical protein